MLVVVSFGEGHWSQSWGWHESGDLRVLIFPVHLGPLEAHSTASENALGAWFVNSYQSSGKAGLVFDTADLKRFPKLLLKALQGFRSLLSMLAQIRDAKLVSADPRRSIVWAHSSFDSISYGLQ